MAIKYKWLADRLKELIQKQIVNGMNKLPTEQQLCAKYRVSRQTVRLSLSLLEKEGLIEKKHGSGTYITGLSAALEGNTIGILIYDDQEYIYPEVVNDIQSTLSANGFSSKVFVTKNCICEEREILLQLLKKPMGGIIAAGCKSALPNPNVDLYRKLEKKGCSVVFLFNYYPPLAECPYIKDDNMHGSGLLVRHLAAQGHTAIGGIFKADDMQGVERYQGFVETMLHCRLPVVDGRISWYDSHDLKKLEQYQDTYFLKKIVQESLASCTAVICYNDFIAYYLIKELHLAGYHLPQDMAIAAFDNSYLSDSNILTLTTVSHEPHEMGNKAAQAMIEKRKGLPVLSQETLWKLKIKESTKINKN